MTAAVARDRRLRIGPYRLLRELGRGTTSRVFLACPLDGGAVVALKVARAPRDPARRRLAASLLRHEVRLAARLQHPNIVPILDTGADGDRVWVAMEAIPGAHTLEQYCTPGHRLAVSRVVTVAAACAAALDCAHRAGVVHRDVKPANVLLGDDGSVRLADFGVAVLGDRDVLDTQPLLPFGSPLYMAPEQIRESEPEPGPAADLHALGVVLHELLIGVHPFAAGTLDQAFRNIVERTPTTLDQRRSGLPGGLSALVAGLLDKDPKRRPQPAAEVAATLQRLRTDALARGI